jgi:hypothetical protein
MYRSAAKRRQRIAGGDLAALTGKPTYIEPSQLLYELAELPYLNNLISKKLCDFLSSFLPFSTSHLMRCCLNCYIDYLFYDDLLRVTHWCQKSVP